MFVEKLEMHLNDCVSELNFVTAKGSWNILTSVDRVLYNLIMRETRFKAHHGLPNQAADFVYDRMEEIWNAERL